MTRRQATILQSCARVPSVARRRRRANGQRRHGGGGAATQRACLLLCAPLSLARVTPPVGRAARGGHHRQLAHHLRGANRALGCRRGAGACACAGGMSGPRSDCLLSVPPRRAAGANPRRTAERLVAGGRAPRARRRLVGRSRFQAVRARGGCCGRRARLERQRLPRRPGEARPTARVLRHRWRARRHHAAPHGARGQRAQVHDVDHDDGEHARAGTQLSACACSALSLTAPLVTHRAHALALTLCAGRSAATAAVRGQGG